MNAPLSLHGGHGSERVGEIKGMRGDCVLAGAPASFVITPLDAHGNPGASGGRFAVELICEAEAASEERWPRSVESTVTESSSGATPLLARGPQDIRKN